MNSFKEREYRQLGMVAERAFTINGSREHVTPRELEILMVMRSGITHNRALAGKLFITEHTLKNHLTRLFDKFGLVDCAPGEFKKIQLLQAAMAHLIISPYVLYELIDTPLPLAFEVELPEIRHHHKPRKKAVFRDDEE